MTGQGERGEEVSLCTRPGSLMGGGGGVGGNSTSLYLEVLALNISTRIFELNISLPGFLSSTYICTGMC